MSRYRNSVHELLTPTLGWRVAMPLAITVGMLAASPCLAAWQNSYNFGATLQGDLYTPSKLATPPAILVVIHMCTGHSSTVHGWFDSYADSNGFYLIAPDAGKQCFDASASRTGDKAAIVTMVNAVVNLGGDKTRVFATGMSSGGCMTNTLLAIYPDVFVGGSAMPGFPAGTWPAGDTTCTKCGSTPPNQTAQQWGDMARNVFSWSGTYPCVQQWVGGGDQYNFNLYLPDVAAQFTNLMGISGTGTAGTGAPSGWTRTVYKDTSGNVRVETNLGPTSQTHDLEAGNLNPPITNPDLYGRVVTFLGLDKPTGACGITSTGGASSTGGTSSTGGSESTGGMTSTGGTKSTGGATSTTGAGGTVSTNTGGTKAATGGTTSAGGAVSITGGTKATGGAISAGGTISTTGGANATGGALSTGGLMGNGGSALAGGGLANISGAAALGGAADVGGNSASAGTQTAGTAGGGNSSDNVGSCSCRVAGQRSTSLASLGLLGLAVLRSMRRRKSQ